VHHVGSFVWSVEYSLTISKQTGQNLLFAAATGSCSLLLHSV